jgi:predicted dienelactone hydrolase
VRSLMFSLLLVLAGLSPASADPRSLHASMTRITVQDTTPFEAVIAYPTEAAEASVEEGLFRLSASRDAPVAAGARFPIVLFSHGGGRRPGTPLAQGGLLLDLARQGFIVVAPFHPATEKPFVDRPRQMHKALDSLLADPRFSQRADPDRIAMAGFSFGGAVTLIAAGANVDLATCRPIATIIPTISGPATASPPTARGPRCRRARNRTMCSL